MPRFVILRHEIPQGVHFDLMLEEGDVLKTWSLPEPPQPGKEIECQSLADHRLAYLDYEGPISGGRGSVTRWDYGGYAVERQSDREWVLRLTGEQFTGTIFLRSQWECGTEKTFLTCFGSTAP
jgi:hypothetical protein